ncbi:MAG TPA: hypothetical protein VGL53_03600 [Bryobacteraceae bacterium]|jgi:mono/diheme cytochrome c family protein
MGVFSFRSSASAAVIFACSGAAAFSATTATGADVTFTRDIAPILYKHCVVCHHAGDVAPMSLITYREVKPWASAIREQVLTKKMPPWKADPHYGVWSNDPSLSETELAKIVKWTESGKLEGDPAALPAAPVFSDGWRHGKPDLVISIPPFKLAATGPDENISIDVPTNFKEDVWITAAESRPGNRRVVHHSHVFVKDPEDMPKPAGASAKPANPAREYAHWLMLHEGTLSFMRPDAPVIDDGCVIDDNGDLPGSTQNDLGSLLSSYLPGREPDVYPPGTARRIPAGAKLNFQLHYSRSGKDEVDESSVGLWIAKEPPKQIARRIDLHNHMFLIPAGDGNHLVTECHTFHKDMYITSLTPHMHFRGKDMRIEATYPDGRKETLLYVPDYNFFWQITYRAAKPLYLPKGTRIAVIAHFDNSVNNKLNPDPTKVIRWGSASETEMMDGWIEYVDTPPAVQ